jgi:hypothetical protein
MTQPTQEDIPMKAQSRTPILLSLLSLPLGMGLAATGMGQSEASHAHNSHPSASSKGPLVAKVRAATARYRDISVALSEGWVRGTPCVSGPNSGAMGVHFIKPERLRDGVIKADQPEALIYEPLPGGAYRLVGVEYIVIAEDWAIQHPNPDDGTPALEGHLTNYVGAPNRYGLPAFYEIHVWAWQHNPQGSFADFNTLVSCEKQRLD